MSSDIARQLQITNVYGDEVLYTQHRNGNVIRERIDGTIPPVIVGQLISDAKADDDAKYQQHIRFKGMIAIYEWNQSYHQAVLSKRFAEYPLPKPKKIFGITATVTANYRGKKR